MTKSEKGWYFSAIPTVVPQDVIKSDPVAYPRFKPFVVEEAQESENKKAFTARGKLISGSLGSLLEGDNGEGVGFMTQSDIGKAIFAVSGDGGICEA